MLPMLITLPGPGSNAPPAIDVEMLQPAPVLPKHAADPATTSALPKVEASPAQSHTEHAKPEKTAQPIEVPPDDMPQQIASPDASAPAGIDALTPKPLAATMVKAPALEPQEPEEVKQVRVEPDAATTSSIVPVATNPDAENLGGTPTEASPPPSTPLSEIPQLKPEPRPEIVRADPSEETPPQAAPEEDAAEAETPAARPIAKPVSGKKPAPQTKPKAEISTKAKAKTEPAAAKKRQAVTAKRTAPQRRVVRGRPQTPINQGIMSFFGSALKPPAGVNASARRPEVRQ
jgi:hypothetical protein